MTSQKNELNSNIIEQFYLPELSQVPEVSIERTEVSVDSNEEVDMSDTPFKDYTNELWILHFIEMGYKNVYSLNTDKIIQNIAKIIKGTKVKVMKTVWTDGSFSYSAVLCEPSDTYNDFINKFNIKTTSI